MGTTTRAKISSDDKFAALKCRTVRLLHRVGNAMLSVAQGVLFRAAQSPQRILIFRTGSFGDGICAIPAICSIRKKFPQARLDVLTNTGHAGQNLVSIDQLIAPEILNQVLNYQSQNRSALVRQIRRNHYDLVIQLPQYNAPLHRLLRDMLVFRVLCGIPAGFGWQWDAVHIFRKAQEALVLATNERRRLLDILEKDGVPALDETSFALHFQKSDDEVAEAKLRAVFLKKKPIIAIVAGAKRPQNRWPVAYFATVCRHFSSRFNIVCLGGPDDAKLVAEMVQEQSGTYSLCGHLSPMQNAWVLKKCAVVLSNDTGLMHLAYAVNAPLVALFSARDLPGRWYPPNRDNVQILRRFDVPCSICLSETCADNICMQAIEVRAVIDAMEELLCD